MIILPAGHIFLYLQKLLPNNAIIVEAGACDGRDTFQLARQFPAGRIVAFEPVPDLFNALQERVAPFCNVVCIQAALSRTTSSAPFYVATKKSTQRVTQTSSLLEPRKEYAWTNTSFDSVLNVDTFTIDDWARQNNITCIDFIWLDAQGAELAILSAAVTILKTVTAIWMEVSDVQRYHNQPTSPHVLKVMHRYGFVPIAQSAPEKNVVDYKTMLFVKNK